MQFSEHLVLPKFESHFFPEKKPKNCHKIKIIDPLKQKSENCSINALIENNSEFPLVQTNSFDCLNEEIFEKTAKKYSFDELQPAKCIQHFSSESKDNSKISMTSSTSSGEHNSYYSCVANLETSKKKINFLMNEIFHESKRKQEEENLEKIKSLLKNKPENFMERKKHSKNKTLSPTNKHYVSFNNDQTKFKKLSQEEILENYQNQIKKTSNLSKKLFEVNFFFLNFLIEFQTFSNSPNLRTNTRTIKVISLIFYIFLIKQKQNKVFPFGKSDILEITVTKKETVLRLIEKIIQKYMSDPTSDKSLMKFPFNPNGTFNIIDFIFYIIL